MSRPDLKLARSMGQQILEIRAEELRLKRAARNRDAGKNLPNAVADVSIPFPWETELRAISPINTIHSHLRAYWYRSAQRWVLYDVLPVELIVDDMNTGSGISGAEFKMIVNGPRPSEREDFKDLDHWPISDTQHEMFRLYRGFARPFWILQGEQGGHQHQFSPFQAEQLLRMGLPAEPPRIGSLPPCPFDNRAIRQLNHLNRLHQFQDSVDRLRESGSPEAAAAEMERIGREVRDSEMSFIEAQFRPVVDMAMSLRQRSEHADQLVEMAPGMASRAKDAYQTYQETGVYTL